ncbi:MAG: hypothetical protein EAZ06_08880 [Cytophagales bacterium]|nr:MAG: hypothetical protein EAY69_01100 [Cytophagales bacterium]TAH28809.1 MAG: hypothetical protein EAZ06_08880 [Cytophagales bacterium]
MAQQPEKLKERLEKKRQEIDNLKTEIVEARLNLKPEQVAPFRKLYDEYSLEKVQLRRKIMRAKRTNLSLAATDEELNQSLDELLEMKQKEVEIEKTYKAKFLKVINIRQIAEIYRSEQEFIRRLMDVLKEKPHLKKNKMREIPEDD